MDIDVQTIKLSGFEDYLIKKGHSTNVVRKRQLQPTF